MKKQNKNKIRYMTFIVLGYCTMILPVLIFNCVNYQILTKISGVRLAFSTMIGFSMLGVAILTKMKSRGGWFTLLIGILLVIMGEASTQIGYSLLFIGGGIVVDMILWKPLALHYKGVWYAETGRTITYTRSID